MSSQLKEKIPSLSQDYGFEQLRLTENGIELFEGDPSAIGEYVGDARTLVYREEGWKDDYEWLGSGHIGHVYGFPDRKDMCLKIVSRHTMRESYGKADDVIVRVPDMTVETRLMDYVERRLSQRAEYGVKSPKQYGIVKFEKGYGLLQQRIPDKYRSLRSTYNEIEHMEDPDEKEAQKKAFDADLLKVRARTKLALGITCLRLGTCDIVGNSRTLNTGNFFTDPDKSALDTDIYALDLVGNRINQRTMAKVAIISQGIVSKISPTLQTVLHPSPSNLQDNSGN